MLVGEVTKMRQQYEQLISQMEQTKDIIDKQQVSSILTVWNIPDIIVYILLFSVLVLFQDLIGVGIFMKYLKSEVRLIYRFTKMVKGTLLITLSFDFWQLYFTEILTVARFAFYFYNFFMFVLVDFFNFSDLKTKWKYLVTVL